MIEAAVKAATSTKKPELPAFDSKNIDLWIKQIENAHTRASITDSKKKFALLESKLGTGIDPKINDFLFGKQMEIHRYSTMDPFSFSYDFSVC